MYSQRSLAIGEWDAHLPYGEGKWVTQSAEEIIYSTGLSLLYIDKDDLNPRFVDKVKGLSDVGISRLQYDPFNVMLETGLGNSQLLNLSQFRLTGNKGKGLLLFHFL